MAERTAPAPCLLEAWRRVVEIGRVSWVSATSLPFRHGFRGGWEAGEAEPSPSAAYWLGGGLIAYGRFREREGLLGLRGLDEGALEDGFRMGLAERIADERDEEQEVR